MHSRVISEFQSPAVDLTLSTRVGFLNHPPVFVISGRASTSLHEPKIDAIQFIRESSNSAGRSCPHLTNAVRNLEGRWNLVADKPLSVEAIGSESRKYDTRCREDNVSFAMPK